MQVSAINSPDYTAPSGGLGGFVKAGQTPAQQRKAVAGQFEAILVRQFLQESVNSMMGKDGGPGSGVYGYLLTDTLAQKLTQGGGLGLSKVIEKQLTPRGAATDATATGASASPAASTQATDATKGSA